MKVVLMAGGKGTRLASIASDIPKPMVSVEGIPVLEREIDNLRRQGFQNIIITVSHLGKTIMEYFGNGDKISPKTGKNFGVHIEYFFENQPLGNAGALFKIRDKLLDSNDEDSFLLLNADAVFDVDFSRMIRFHREKKAKVTLFTHPNSHPYDSGLVLTDERQAVTGWLTKEDVRPEFYKNRVNAGLHVISVSVLDDFLVRMSQNAIPQKVDLDRMLLKPLVGHGMYAYDSPEYVKDMGTPDRYEAVCNDFRNGIVLAKNLHRKQKAVFLDRDGTINKYVGFLRTPDQFELLPGVSQAIRHINESGYLCIVITNQPVIARGEVTYQQLQEIHNKMEMLLGLDGAYVDGVYFCPHHPEKGFVGEVVELKRECECRKPKSGMLIRAAADFNIDLCQSYMIGDSRVDIEAGKAAGCTTVLLSNEEIDMDQDFQADNLLEAMRLIGIA